MCVGGWVGVVVGGGSNQLAQLSSGSSFFLHKRVQGTPLLHS